MTMNSGQSLSFWEAILEELANGQCRPTWEEVPAAVTEQTLNTYCVPGTADTGSLPPASIKGKPKKEMTTQGDKSYDEGVWKLRGTEKDRVGVQSRIESRGPIRFF